MFIWALLNLFGQQIQMNKHNALLWKQVSVVDFISILVHINFEIWCFDLVWSTLLKINAFAICNIYNLMCRDFLFSRFKETFGRLNHGYDKIDLSYGKYYGLHKRAYFQTKNIRDSIQGAHYLPTHIC